MKKEKRSTNKKELNNMFRKILITLTLISIISVPVFAGSYNYDQSSVVVPTSKYMKSSNTNVIWVDYTQDDSDFGYFLNAGTTTITADGKQFNFEVTGTSNSSQGRYINFIKNWTISGSTDYDKIKNTLIWFKNNGYKYTSDGYSKGYTMIELKEGDCLDYSHLLHRLCQTMGIPCNTVSASDVGMESDSSLHVCNVCYLNGHYYAVDLSAMIDQNGNLDNSMKLLD